MICVDMETTAIQGRPNYPPEPVGVAIKRPRRSAVYYAFGHPTGNNATREEAIAALRAAWASGDGLLFHNASFDLAVAMEKLGLPMPARERIHDTMIAAHLNDPYEPTFALKPLAEKHLAMPPTERDAVRDWLVAEKVCRSDAKDWGAFIAFAPGDLVSPYACGDVERTLQLFDKLAPSGEAYDRERFLIPVLMENERQGIRVDTAALEDDAAKYDLAISEAEKWLRARLQAPELNFNSSGQLADALEAAKVVFEFATTATGKRSTSKGTMTEDKFRDREVFLALGYRSRLQTCLSTFIHPWLETARQSSGRIFTRWRQLGAVTGRMSSSPNFQNMPKSWTDKPDGYEHPAFLGVPELPLLRRYILPDEGQVLVACDYSGQEVRVAAHFEDGELLDGYRANPEFDPHAVTAATLKVLSGGTEYSRRTCKVGLFSTLYGAGGRKIAEQLGTDEATGALVKQAIFQAFPGIRALDNELKQRGREGKPFTTLGGRRYFAEPGKVVNGVAMDFTYKMLNTLVQGSSADQTKAALLRYDSCKKHGRLMLVVHDELVISVPEEYALDEGATLSDCMVNALPIDTPMLADPSTPRATYAESK